MRQVGKRRPNLFVGKFPALEPFNQVAPNPRAFCLVDFLPTGLARQCMGYFTELEQSSFAKGPAGFRKQCGLYVFRQRPA